MCRVCAEEFIVLLLITSVFSSFAEAMVNSAEHSMSCITVSGYGDIDQVIDMSHSAPKPCLRKGKGNILIKVLAVSLAPGDCRVMSGKTTLMQAPESMPYIPGGDCCGIVEEVDDEETIFKIGDCVVAMFDTLGPRNALAQYKVVKRTHAAMKPTSITPEEAAALPSSALSAMLGVENHLKEGDRVMVLGGSGGVGCHLIQLLKPNGASFVASTSTQRDLLTQLGADEVIDYRSENWWELDRFRDEPFDIVFDLWGTREAWEHAKSSGALKPGSKHGRFVTIVGDEQNPILQNVLQVPRLMYNMLARSIWTSVVRSEPSWVYHVGLEPRKGNLQRLMRIVEEGKLKALLDPNSPFSFDAASVKKAFHLQKSRHSHGKVVISVAGRNNDDSQQVTAVKTRN